MDQQGQVQLPIHELLASRWSPRAFDDRLVDTDLLRILFEAARWAPSSNNEQPWRFIVATKDQETDWTRLFDCLVEGNRRWAFRAPVLVLSVASMNFQDKRLWYVIAAAVVILIVVLFNALLGFWQEHRAEATLAALKKMLAPLARVRRGGEVIEPKGTMRALRQALKDQAQRAADTASNEPASENSEALSPEDSAPAAANPFIPSSPLVLPSSGGEAQADVPASLQGGSAAGGSDMSPTPHERAPRPLDEVRRVWPSGAAIEAARKLKAQAEAKAAPKKEPK